MLDILQATVTLLMMGYYSLVIGFLYCFIPMFMQTIICLLILEKQIWKPIVVCLITQGLTVLLSGFLYEGIDSLIKYGYDLGKDNLPFNIIGILILLPIIILIQFFAYKTIHISRKKLWLSIAMGYGSNVVIMTLLMFFVTVGMFGSNSHLIS